jgi:hypothetical protein
VVIRLVRCQAPACRVGARLSYAGLAMGALVLPGAMALERAVGQYAGTFRS